jgi:transposase
LSQETQDLLDQLDHHEQQLEQIVEKPLRPRLTRRHSTHELLERLDEHNLKVEQLLHAGADLLAAGNQMGCCTRSADWSKQSQLQDEDVCLSDDDAFDETSSTTASSCGDLHSDLSSPRSFRLVSDDEDDKNAAVLGSFNMWLAAEELKYLHKEISAARKQLSAVHIERLSKAVEVLTNAMEAGKRRQLWQFRHRQHIASNEFDSRHFR